MAALGYAESPGWGAEESIVDEPQKSDPLMNAIKKIGAEDPEPVWSAHDVANYAAQHHIRKFTDTEAAATNKLIRAALAYAKTYEGDFDYMLSMQERVKSGRAMSLGMARGILNCMLAEVRRSAAHELANRAIAEAQRETPEPTVKPIGALPANGIYTLQREDGKHLTIWIAPHWDKSVTSVRIVSALIGPDNTSDFAKFGFLSEDGFRAWKSGKLRGSSVRIHQSWIDAVYALCGGDVDLEEAGYSYAIRSGRCWRCGRVLTVPASIHRGLGPVCAGKV